MSKGVTKAQIEEFRKSFDSDPSATVAQNAVSNADLSTLALRRDLSRTWISRSVRNWMIGMLQTREEAVDVGFLPP